MGAILGNLAGIMAIVTGAVAAIFSARLDRDSPQFSPALTGFVLFLAVAAALLFVAGCTMLVRDTRRARQTGGAAAAEPLPETLKADGLIGADGQPTRVTRSYAPRESFILGLPLWALGLAAVAVVIDVLGIIDLLPSLVVPIATAMVVAFAAFMVVRRLQKNLARARMTSLFERAPAQE